MIDYNAYGNGQKNFDGTIIQLGAKSWNQVVTLLKNLLVGEELAYTLEDVLEKAPKTKIELDEEYRAWLHEAKRPRRP